MRVIIYTSSSFGGCYDYGLQLHAAYLAHPQVESCQMVFPENAALPHRTDFHPILMPDQLAEGTDPRIKKLHFIRRAVRNPLTLLRFVRSQPPSLVIFNDFEQITAPFWVPAFKATARRHRYAAVLHDPDRDGYPPSKAVSERCMKALMSLMELGLYHQYLPAKPYYAPNGVTRYLDVPHGLYPPPPPNSALAAEIAALKRPNLQYAAILGNVRKEKNYHLVLEAMTNLPDLGLIVAGRPSNTSEDAATYLNRAAELGLQDRVIWIDRYLSDAEMAAVIDQADMILLYYAKSFSSQSGILNMVAPMRKTIIASDGTSSLAAVIRRFSIGLLAQPDDVQALRHALMLAVEGFGPNILDWGYYLEYASWQGHTEVVISALEDAVEEAIVNNE